MTRPALPLMLVLLAGCGGGPAPLPTPVAITGKVSTPQGKPFGNVMLTLHPQDDAAQGNRPTVLVQADGTFAASCFPGGYRVTLTPLPNGPGDGGPGASGHPTAGQKGGGIPAEYLSATASPWVITVKESGNEEFKHTLGVK